MDNIIENYKKVVFKNYATFTGRALRSEYWYFVLASVIISIILEMVEGMFGIAPDSEESVLSGIYSLLVLVPSIAVGVRRIHDSDKSGWWILLPLYNLYLLIRKGTEGENRFGAAVATESVVTQTQPSVETEPATQATDTTMM